MIDSLFLFAALLLYSDAETMRRIILTKILKCLQIHRLFLNKLFEFLVINSIKSCQVYEIHVSSMDWQPDTFRAARHFPEAALGSAQVP